MRRLTRRTRLALGALTLAAHAAAARADLPWPEPLERGLAIATADGRLSASLSGLADLEAYYIDQRPPGLVFGGDSSFVNPRLSLFLDLQAGRQLYGFLEARVDRGFDPREHSFPEIRLDEYLLRWSPFGDPTLHLQVGKFATVVGNWVARHDSWANPLINAPLPYENVTTVSDGAAPADPTAFLARRNLPDRKRLWVPIVWGPDYTSGASVFGHVAFLDYAAEVKNASLSARPYVWDATDRTWDEPTGSGRLGVRPSPAWNLGASFSWGPYLLEDAAPTLPPGRSTADFPEMVAATDASYAWRHLELWAEFFAARFAVPNVGDADTAAWYVEGRYGLGPRLFAALRWNQQIFGDVNAPAGGSIPWDHDVWRVDSAIGYRLDRHLQAKLQYSFTHQAGPIQQGEQLVAAQLTLCF